MKTLKVHLFKRIGLLIPMFLLLANSSFAGDPEKDIVIGKEVAIYSDILNEERELMIYLPPLHNTSETLYPVLYLLDGSVHFHHTTGIVSYLSRLGSTPPMIVVAIKNIDRNRDFSPTHVERIPTSGGAEKFLAFLDQELIPYVDENYKTESFRILMGHSFGGTFATYSLLSQPELFNAYIAISPYLHYDDSYLVEQAGSQLKSKYNTPVFFYMTVGNEQNYFDPLKKFYDTVKEKSGKGVNFEYTIMEKEDHGSVPHLSIYNGLKYIFSSWQIPDSEMKKGLEAVDQYYQNISNTLGYKVNTPENIINTLGYNHLRNNEIDEAIRVFKENVRRYPESPNVYDSLGEAYENNDQTDLARKNYQKAYELAKQTGDPRTELFHNNLKRVQE